MRLILPPILTVIISVVFSFNQPDKIFAGDLYAILVADTDAVGIGADAAESAKWVHGALKGNVIANNLKVLRLDGKNVTKQKIFDAINFIPKNQGHTVFFYYVGHGYYDNGSLLAPILEGNKYIPMQDIISRIKKRRPKSIVTLNDSCSIQPNGERLYAAPVMPPPQANSPLANKLFFNHGNWIHLNSSAPGEYALSHSANLRDGKEIIFTGSPFAIAFFEAMQNTPNPKGWNEIASEISKKVKDSYKQTAPDGRLRLKGKIVNQPSQTVRGLRDGELFIGGSE